MTTVGFDFGNMNCLIARCGRGGVDVLLNGASVRQVIIGDGKDTWFRFRHLCC